MDDNFLKYYYDHTYNVKKQFTPNKIILLSYIFFLILDSTELELLPFYNGMWY